MCYTSNNFFYIDLGQDNEIVNTLIRKYVTRFRTAGLILETGKEKGVSFWEIS